MAAWALGGIIVVGVAIRFATLGQQSFWLDEGATWNVIRAGFGHVISTVPRTESTPPLYYVLVWIWSRAFGTGEVGLRSFSALCGTLMIPTVWALGRRLFSERAGLIAAVLVAVNPLLVWFSQEARAYSMLALMGALSLLALVRALEQPTHRRLLAWGVVAALALCTHYFSAVVVGPEAVALVGLLVRRGSLTRAGAALALGPPAAMAAALLPLVVHQNDGRASFIANETGSLGYRFVQLGKEDVIGYGQPAKVALTLIGGAVVLVALAWLLRAGRRDRAGAALPLWVGGAGVLLALFVSALITDYFSSRNLLGTWPALALIIAGGLAAPRRMWPAAGATAVLAALNLFCIANVVRNPLLQRTNWRGAVQAMGASPRHPRAIVSDIESPIALPPYLRGLSSFPAAGARVSEVDLLWLRRAQWGPLLPLSPRPLPGFSESAIHASTFIVVRYRAPAPVLVPKAEIAGLFPIAPLAIPLLQRPARGVG